MRAAQAFQRLVIAGAATALIAACGSSGGSGAAVIPSGAPGGSVQTLLASSVDKTVAAKNAKIRLDFTGSVGGQNVSFGGDGIADFAAKKYELTMNLPAAAGIGGAVQERVIGQDVYVMLPSAESSLTGGKPWIKFSTSELGASSTTGLNLTGSDPTQLLATLRGVSDSITKVGTAQIRGVETTHYRAEVNLTKAIQKSGADASGLEQFTKTLGSNTIPEDVYLDKDGLPRRFAVTINPVLPSTSAGASAATSSFTVTVDLYDFGTTDTSGITAPPADQVGDLGSVPGGTGSGTTSG